MKIRMLADCEHIGQYTYSATSIVDVPKDQEWRARGLIKSGKAELYVEPPKPEPPKVSIPFKRGPGRPPKDKSKWRS